MKINDVFYVSSGKRIVASDAYKNKGNIPFVAAQTKNEGIIRCSSETWLNKITKNGKQVMVNQPCITWTKNGYAGKLFYRDYKFYPGDDCGILIPREEHKGTVNLKWFVYFMQDYIMTFSTSKGTQGKIFDGQMKKIDFEMPKKDVQDKMVVLYEGLLSYKAGLTLIVEKTSRQLNSVLFLEDGITIPISKIIDITGGTSGLTEDIIYHNKPTNFENRVKVYSASILDSTSMGYIDKNTKIGVKNIKIFKAPAVIIIRNGEAGKTIAIPQDDFTTTDHAYVVSIKDAYKNAVEIEWLDLILEKLTMCCVSSKDSNGTFNKQMLLTMNISIPEIDTQKKVLKDYKDLRKIYNNAKKIIKGIDKI